MTCETGDSKDFSINEEESQYNIALSLGICLLQSGLSYKPAFEKCPPDRHTELLVHLLDYFVVINRFKY